ncbi:AraC family transcriptional regulator [Longimycelium tulufanense]|uniref:AraC family transcriptional regulator n=1 Tax=Longimycelium tulufanense TaxID=907463 RepID=UPI001662C6BB|nr:helix-turn-helix domain-containing protein [Longimycelium tulufanense]
MPDGTVSIVLTLEGQLQIMGPTPSGVGHSTKDSGYRLFRSLVVGVHTVPRLGGHDGRWCGVAILLAPWSVRTVLGLAAHELTDQIVDLDEVLSHTFSGELLERLGEARSWADRFALLDRTLVRRPRPEPTSLPRVVSAWRELERRPAGVLVPRLADEVGWGRRRLESCFREQIGLSPGNAARVLRLQHALHRLVEGGSVAEAATAAGYFDQPHLNHEFRRMVGRTPTEFLRARRLRLPGPPLEDRAPGLITSAVASPLRTGTRQGRPARTS